MKNALGERRSQSLTFGGINYPLYRIANRELSNYSCGGLWCNGNVGRKLSLTIKI